MVGFSTIQPANEIDNLSMATNNHQPELPPAIRRLLDVVRRRIRAYVWIEGLALVAVLLGVSFWVGLIADWTFEPSVDGRRLALLALAALLLLVVYHVLLRRVFVPIADSSLAVLLERRFPNLKDHVLTAVDVAAPENAAEYNPELMSRTHGEAVRAIAGIDAGEVFDRGPVTRAVTAAVMLAASILIFAAMSRETFGFWIERIALSDKLWPRRVSLEVVGFAPDAAGNRVHKLAQDDDYELLVHALTDGFEIPDEVEIRFRLADGRRGRDTMIRVGEAVPGRDESQVYRYEFKRVAGDMRFDVVGGDDRVQNLELRVVDRPELFAIELECIYPSYLQRESRRLPVTGGMRIPEGTQLVLHAKSTKPLTAAKIHSAHNEHDAAVAFDKEPQDTLRWGYGTLSDDDVLTVSVTDFDKVVSRDPYRVSLAVVRDEVPQVAVRLAGIGTAITPEAVLPVKGKITDDYGLDRAWYEFQVDSGAAGIRPLAQLPAGESEVSNLGEFDTRAIDESTGKRALELRPGQRLALSLRAADRFDLSDEPRAGSSQRFVLDVVTTSELLALLERRELQLRQRYEAIYEKVTDTRNLLARVKFDDEAAASEEEGETGRGGEGEKQTEKDSSSPPLSVAPSPTLSSASQRALARRRLRVAGSLQNVVQSADEITGVAEAFDDLHDQLTNNRIDIPDLKSRLREQIAQPLHRIAEERMPQLVARLELVEEHLQDDAAAPELARAIALADEVLVEMRQVLDRMLELETYNEVLDLLRGIITDQQEINRRTKERQKERLRSLFEEDEE
jgi:hypothetical protein